MRVTARAVSRHVPLSIKCNGERRVGMAMIPYRGALGTGIRQSPTLCMRNVTGHLSLTCYCATAHHHAECLILAVYRGALACSALELHRAIWLAWLGLSK